MLAIPLKSIVEGLEVGEDPVGEGLYPLVPFPMGAGADFSKLAQEMRVLFAKCTTIERLPKNEPRPSCVDENGSV